MSNFRRKRRRILVIVNPFGGQQKAWKMWQEIVKPIFIAAQLDYKYRILMWYCVVVYFDRNNSVVCIEELMSGDGLISEVIEGFLLRSDRERALKMPIAHIPGGTSNALAASICFQCKLVLSMNLFVFFTHFILFTRTQLIFAALMVARPRYLPLRICHVQTEKDGDRSMFLSITWGLVADIGE
ncbi:unnamed protein product [Anisakis simplex]|uniref:Sphingosine kinase 1 (inferred by orthology to a C. elegans protein) n=1 Tax=Anisakis simplex TaxID=6269 RepID=A0A0M3J494_ANISI|nr:unnamed protein product [Anisakis simplex]